MYGAVVHEEIDVFIAGVDLAKQPTEVAHEVIAGFLLREHHRELAGMVVQSAKCCHSLILTGGGDSGSLTTQDPHAGQLGIEVKLSFIKIDECYATRRRVGVFLACSFSLFARDISSGSCLCLRSSLGRL